MLELMPQCHLVLTQYLLVMNWEIGLLWLDSQGEDREKLGNVGLARGCRIRAWGTVLPQCAFEHLQAQRTPLSCHCAVSPSSVTLSRSQECLLGTSYLIELCVVECFLRRELRNSFLEAGQNEVGLVLSVKAPPRSSASTMDSGAREMT